MRTHNSLLLGRILCSGAVDEIYSTNGAPAGLGSVRCWCKRFVCLTLCYRSSVCKRKVSEILSRFHASDRTVWGHNRACQRKKHIKHPIVLMNTERACWMRALFRKGKNRCLVDVFVCVRFVRSEVSFRCSPLIHSSPRQQHFNLRALRAGNVKRPT